jgi:hypothetical protein
LPGAIRGAPAPPPPRLHATGRNIGVFLGPILLAEATKLSGGWSAAWPLFGSTTLAAMAVAGVLVLMLRMSRSAPEAGAPTEVQGTRR